MRGRFCFERYGASERDKPNNDAGGGHGERAYANEKRNAAKPALAEQDIKPRAERRRDSADDSRRHGDEHELRHAQRRAAHNQADYGDRRAQRGKHYRKHGNNFTHAYSLAK